MQKRVWITVGVVFIVAVLAGLGAVAYRVKQALSAAERVRTVPNELRTAKIVTGARRFSNEVLLTQADLGVVTDFAQSSNHELIVVGQNGAAFLNDATSLNKTVPFHGCSTAVVAIRSAGNTFLCRGGAWITNVELFDADGKTLWSYDRGLVGINDAAAGSLGPNPTTNIVVGFNGAGGVRLLSSEGKEMWKQDDGKVWHVEIAPASDKSRSVILHSNARGQLTVRDPDGHIVGRYQPEIYVASFSMTSWGDDSTRNKIIASDKDLIYVFTIEGKTLVRLPSPGSAAMADSKGTQHVCPRRVPILSVFCVIRSGTVRCCTSMTGKTNWSITKFLTIIATHCIPFPPRTEPNNFSSAAWGKS